jgi:hypothetical protein
MFKKVACGLGFSPFPANTLMLTEVGKEGPLTVPSIGMQGWSPEDAGNPESIKKKTARRQTFAAETKQVVVRLEQRYLVCKTTVQSRFIIASF